MTSYSWVNPVLIFLQDPMPFSERPNPSSSNAPTVSTMLWGRHDSRTCPIVFCGSEKKPSGNYYRAPVGFGLARGLAHNTDKSRNLEPINIKFLSSQFHQPSQTVHKTNWPWPQWWIVSISTPPTATWETTMKIVQAKRINCTCRLWSTVTVSCFRCHLTTKTSTSVLNQYLGYYFYRDLIILKCLNRKIPITWMTLR